MRAPAFFRRNRIVLLALLASLLLHAAALKGIPGFGDRRDEPDDGIAYSATLEPAGALEAAPQASPAPRAKAKPRRAAASKPRFVPIPEIDDAQPLERIAADDTAAPARMADDAALEKILEAPPEPAPEKLALAAPAAAEAQAAPKPFPTDALPQSLSISYALTSAFADGKADYEWKREGDSYTIHGEAQAEGFFTLFLEGRIIQETRGTVTPQGLRPERFIEKRPGAADEGLAFDWKQNQVTFELGDKHKTGQITGNSVDWLSMIFQLAHVPPKPKGDTLDMSVFTQRTMYSFRLKVLGVEEIEIPMGKVRAMHLQHTDDGKHQVVDVWLGVDQHYLPVKMRYPVARNRLMVEQSATRVTTR